MLNKIMLIGNLGREPEMSYTPSGKAITKFSLAVSRYTGGRETEERQKETQWFNIVAWEQLAERCSSYLHKGSKVYIEGRMTSRKYTDKDGVERTAWEVVASGMEMLDSRAPQEQSSGGSGGYGEGDVGPDDIPF